MSDEKSRIVRVAAVQMESKNGLVEANLKHATPLVEQAARDGDGVEFDSLAAVDPVAA